MLHSHNNADALDDKSIYNLLHQSKIILTVEISVTEAISLVKPQM